jgi:uncharacterized damage-inducible protein DinB
MCVGLVQTYRAFAYNNAWANYRLLGVCAELTQGEFEVERTGFFPSLQATLNHIRRKIRMRARVMGLDAVFQMVQAGVGIAIVPDTARPAMR